MRNDLSDTDPTTAALHASEARYRRAERGTQNGVWEWDLDTDEYYVSPCFCAMLGYTPDELSARPRSVSALLHPDDLAQVRAALDRHARLGQRHDVEFRMRHKNGDYLWVRSRGQISEEAGVRRMTGSISDITQQEQMARSLREVNEALQRSVAEKELLLREIHHRVKNNLAVVGSLVHFHVRQLSAEHDAASLRALQQRIKAMSLVHERLYQAPDVGRVDFPGYVQLLVEDLRGSSLAQAQVEVEIGAKQLRLPLEIALPTGQILAELITNAINHGADGRPEARVRVAIRDAGASVEFSVVDDGPGLPPDFDPETSGAFGWLLVRTLVKQLEAELELRPGPGTEVRVRVPLPP